MSGCPKAKRRYYEKNRQVCIDRSARWREDNREKYNAKMIEHKYKDGPDAAKRRARGYALKRKYGISLEQYEELLAKQEDKCAICLSPASQFKINLAVDHNHKTGEIRGALCTYCNHRMIGRHTDAEKLRRMADYVDQGTGWFVPEKKKKVRKKKT